MRSPGRSSGVIPEHWSRRVAYIGSAMMGNPVMVEVD